MGIGIALTHDDHYLIGGNSGQGIDFLGDNLSGALLKVNKKGVPVSGFQKVTVDGTVTKTEVLIDGKILMSGDFNHVNGRPTGKLVRLSSDGSLDLTFAASASDEILNFVVQSSGKIIITGRFTNYDGKGYADIARLNVDGSVDETFKAKNIGFVYEISINASDEILVAKATTLVKLTADGLVDGSFVSNIGTTKTFNQLEAIPGGSWLASVRDYSTQRYQLKRLHANGNVDDTFTPIDETIYIYNFTVLKNGNIIVVIGSPTKTFLYDANGHFLKDLNITKTSIAKIIEDNDNGLLIDGYVQTSVLQRLKSDFSTDPAFNMDLTNVAIPHALGVQSNGKLIIGGTSDFIGVGNIKSHLVRLNAEGSPDVSFNTPIDPLSFVHAIEIQQDDKIIVGGSGLSGLATPNLIRLLPQGGIDASFNAGTPQTSGEDRSIERIRYSNSKIYVSGNFTHYNGQPYASFVILDNTGKIVGPTNSGLPANSRISDIEVQSDGKIILAGGFTFPENSIRKIIRLRADGSLDTDFPILTMPNSVLRNIEVDSQDRILVMGVFDSFNGQPAKDLVRLNKDGSIDPTFNIGTGFTQHLTSNVLDIKILPNEMIALCGSFDIYDGEYSPSFVFLDFTGKRIPFLSEVNSGSNIYKFGYNNGILYGVGKVVYGKGERVSSAAKILVGVPLPVEPTPESVRIPAFPNPFTDKINIELPEESGESVAKLFTLNGTLVLEQNIREGKNVLNVDQVTRGLYLVRIESRSGTRNFIFVKN